jgi:putative DNA primase/helicase
MSAIHRAEHWGTVPYLKSITCHPVVRPDGSVQSRPGYDARTRVLSTHHEDLVVKPLHQSVAKHAREMLLELVDEFPFVGIGADVWLACVLTPLVRAWCGPSPMFVVTSSTPSSGKGRLADLATIISCGGEGIEGGAMPPNDEEWQKCLISWGLSAPEVIYFDNVKSGMRIGSPVLDMALTRDRFSGRILKVSKIVEVELPATWIAAGNNLGTYGDTARRCLICRIEPMVERPECREFKIPDIIGHARKSRTKLISCALGILSGWLTAKKPSPTPPLGSFEKWSDVVRGAILWAGGADVAEALASQVEGADDGAQLHRALLEAWKDTLSLPHSAASLLARCRDPEDLASSDFSAILAELCPGKNSATHGTAQTLSAKLRAMEGRVREVNGVQMVLARFECKGPTQWEVREV